MPSCNYRDLIAWQRAIELVDAVYRASVDMPAGERFGLAGQMRRAGQFNSCEHRRGAHAILAGRLGQLPPAVVDELLREAAEVGRLVNGLTRSLRERANREL